jgi:hypothetical protein
MTELIVSLIVAAVGALGFLAYREPQAYAKLYSPFQVTLVVAFTACLIWNTGVTAGAHQVISFVPFEKFGQAENAEDAAIVPFLWLIVGFGMTNVYLMFLRALPTLISPVPPDDDASNSGDQKP